MSESHPKKETFPFRRGFQVQRYNKNRIYANKKQKNRPKERFFYVKPSSKG